MQAKDDISGTVKIRCPKGTRLEHTGVLIKLIGCVIDYKTGTDVTEFVNEEKDLEKPGVIMGKKVDM